MNQEQIRHILDTQRAYFSSGATLPVEKRVQALQRLRTAILDSEAEINAALKSDLGKSGFESYMCEVGLTCSEISYMIRHARRFAAERRVPTPLAQFHARSYVKPSPYGVVLIMRPLELPLHADHGPPGRRPAAGNTVVLKPSAYSPHTSAVIEKIISSCFDSSYVAVISGGREENQCLLREAFDYIFFTGSQAVGREVLRQAAEHLTPVTLELGGKSPCIVDRTANIPLAAKRIVFGSSSTAARPAWRRTTSTARRPSRTGWSRPSGRRSAPSSGSGPWTTRTTGRSSTRSTSAASPPDRPGEGGLRRRPGGGPVRIEPTVMDNVTWEDPVMGEEIFGPILPVLTFQTLEEAAAQVNSRPHPLALYLFTSDKQHVRYVTTAGASSAAAASTTPSSTWPPAPWALAAWGPAVWGPTTGRWGFDTFSHHKSIVDKKTWLDLPMRYQPYQPFKEKLVRMFLK